MRSLSDAAARWSALEGLSSLDDLKHLVHKDDVDGASSIEGLRSAVWKAFLVTKDVDVRWWPETLAKARETYTSNKSRYLHGLLHRDEEDTMTDPLSEAADSPWATLRHDEDARREILQDVERCMPENLYFRRPATQTMLLDILFVWSKLNSDVGYRQGMHEILAPILWVIERDAVSTRTSSTETYSASTALLRRVYYKESIEHDSFLVFEAVMCGLRSAYETPKAPVVTKRPSKQGMPPIAEPPIVTRARKIIDSSLAHVDPPLAAHLSSLEIPPQLFIMRWIRLLFGREFSFDSTIKLWDCIIAENATSECIDLVCVSMLLRIRWQLIISDYDQALALLLRYPSLPAEHPPYTLAQDVLYLRNHMTYDGGCHIISRRTEQTPHHTERPRTPTSPTTSRPVAPQPPSSAARNVSQPRPRNQLEGLLQNTARGVYARGEQWGVNKALRDAVTDLKTNVTHLRKHDDITSSALPPSETSNALLQTIDDLRARNKTLAKMLEVAVDDLWKQHKDVISQRDAEGEQLQTFTMAVAKVQLAQVYLEDPSLPILEEASNPTFTEMPATSRATATEPPPASMHAGTDGDADLEVVPDRAARHQSQQHKHPPEFEVQSNNPPETVSNTPTWENSKAQQRSRPSLEHSSFSWMLQSKDGEDQPSVRSAFSPARPSSPDAVTRGQA